MPIKWEDYPPKGEYSELAINLVRHIAAEFLTNGKGTSAHKTKVDLRKDYILLNVLIEGRLIRMTASAYFPCFHSSYYLDPEKQSVAELSLECVFNGLRHLYENKGPGEYSSQEIVHAANLVTSRPIAAELIHVGMHFAIEFELFSCTWSGDSQQSVKRMSVDDRILSFEDVGTAWRNEQARRSPPAVRFQPSEEPKVAVDDPLGLFGPPDFSFVKNTKLREIIERDYTELENIRMGVKSRIILAGGLIEGLLADALLCDQVRAQKARPASKIGEWNLSTLIDVALELGFISQGPCQHGHAVRDFRNLVHPGKEMRGDYVVGQHEAHAAELTLRMVIRDLQARNKGTIG
jgi:hypothetical protein